MSDLTIWRRFALAALIVRGARAVMKLATSWQPLVRAVADRRNTRLKSHVVMAGLAFLAATAPTVSLAADASAAPAQSALLTLHVGQGPQSASIPVRFPSYMCSHVPGHPELATGQCLGSLTETAYAVASASKSTAFTGMAGSLAASSILVTQTNAVCGPLCVWRSQVTESTTYYPSTQRFFTNWTDCSQWYSSSPYALSITWCGATGSNTSKQWSGDNLTICVPGQCDGDWFRQWVNSSFQVGVQCGGAGPFGVFC